MMLGASHDSCKMKNQSKEPTPKCLTKPSVGVYNDGCDNEDFELILHVDFELFNLKTFTRYVVKDILGKGVYGQVAKCLVPEKGEFVALKIIKNQEAYTHQARTEIGILNHCMQLNSKLSFGGDEGCHIVKINEWFKFKEHICISFELLGPNLYERMKHHKRFSLDDIRTISEQILRGMVAIKEANIIHCDLKPENILLSKSEDPGNLEVKIIDFGMACREDNTVYSYTQSRYYRSPEVLLGCKYTSAIDMWSFGCIVAELFLNVPLFPACSNYDLLKKMLDILGNQLPDDLLQHGENTCKYFKKNKFGQFIFRSAYQIQSEGNHLATKNEFGRPTILENNYSKAKLEAIIKKHPYEENLSEEEISKEIVSRDALIDFLSGILELNPKKRWSPSQALRHPFIIRPPFGHSYKPSQKTPNIPITSPFLSDHYLTSGHSVPARIPLQASSPGTQQQFSNQNHMSQFGSHNRRNAYFKNMQSNFSPRQQTLPIRQFHNTSPNVIFDDHMLHKDNYSAGNWLSSQHGQVYENDFHHRPPSNHSYNYGLTQQSYVGSAPSYYNREQHMKHCFNSFDNIQPKKNISYSTSNFADLGSAYRDQSGFQSDNSDDGFLTIGVGNICLDDRTDAFPTNSSGNSINASEMYATNNFPYGFPLNPQHYFEQQTFYRPSRWPTYRRNKRMQQSVTTQQREKEGDQSEIARQFFF